MHWDAITVKPLENYPLYVEIQDGRKGVFDVKPYLDFGVFQELKKSPLFQSRRHLIRRNYLTQRTGYCT